jgi:Riboflavin kinase
VSVEAHCLVPGQEGGHPGPTDPSSAAWLDLYGLKVTVFFGYYLRGMVKYEGATWLEELLSQMEKDCSDTMRLTGGRGPHDARVVMKADEKLPFLTLLKPS